MQNPEDDFKVTITDEHVKIEHPERKTEMVRWDNIKEIIMINTDQGPFLPDVWLGLMGDETGCLIPQGCKGYDEIYDIISRYEGFDFEKVIESMSCTGNEQFLLWKSGDRQGCSGSE
ncbi:MAG: hypothetical protein AB2L14_02535 [Candidatus Xenobiia bacterium LiM19]